MFGFLKKIFGSDIPDTPVISQPKVEEGNPTIYSEVKSSPSTTAKKAPAKKPAAKATTAKTTTAKKAPAKKPAATKTDDAPKRRGRPAKSAS